MNYFSQIIEIILVILLLPVAWYGIRIYRHLQELDEQQTSLFGLLKETSSAVSNAEITIKKLEKAYSDTNELVQATASSSAVLSSDLEMLCNRAETLANNLEEQIIYVRKAGKVSAAPHINDAQINAHNKEEMFGLNEQENDSLANVKSQLMHQLKALR